MAGRLFFHEFTLLAEEKMANVSQLPLFCFCYFWRGVYSIIFESGKQISSHKAGAIAQRVKDSSPD
jgi:hypothetical protein